MLPPEFEYTIKSINSVDAGNEMVRHFKSNFTININNSNEFDQWRHMFEQRNKCQFTIAQTKKCEGRYVSFKKLLTCSHNVQNGTVGVRKHTKCPANLWVKMRVIPKRIKRAKFDVESPCEISLTWEHNHPIIAADVLRHHSVDPEVDKKLINLFQHGHSPSSALNCIIMDIEENLQDDEKLEFVLADRAICPDYQHCYYIFQQLFRKQYGDPANNFKLQDFVDETNREIGEVCIVRNDYENSSQVAIVSPFMKRVHEHIEEAGELVFLDSSGGLDRDGLRIFLFMTHSKAGGN